MFSFLFCHVKWLFTGLNIFCYYYGQITAFGPLNVNSRACPCVLCVCVCVCVCSFLPLPLSYSCVSLFVCVCVEGRRWHGSPIEKGRFVFIAITDVQRAFLILLRWSSFIMIRLTSDTSKQLAAAHSGMLPDNIYGLPKIPLIFYRNRGNKSTQVRNG